MNRYRIDRYDGSGVEPTPGVIREYASDIIAESATLSGLSGGELDYPIYGFGDKPSEEEVWIGGRFIGSDGWVQLFRLF